MPLTDTYLRQNKHKDDNGILKVPPYKLYDDGGLFIQVSRSSSKLWRFKYRFDGKEKLLAFGKYPEVSLAEARLRRDAAKALLASQPPIDPSKKRQDDKVDKAASINNTFEKWAHKWWQNWHKDKSHRHANSVIRRLEADVFPTIGKLPINEIQAHEVVETIKMIAARGALDIAKRSHQMMGQVFRYAIAHNKESKTTRNPAADIKPSDIIESRQKKNYARVELKELPALLRALDASNSQPLTRLAVKLMGLTFVRTTELIEAKWKEIDFDEKQWRIPAERMKMKTPHIVPLSRQALQTLYAISGSYDYIFPNQNNHTRTLSRHLNRLNALAL